MAEVLFVTWAGGGNVPPAIGIATELRERGHHVRFLGHAEQRAALEGAGFSLEAYRSAVPWSSTEIAAGPKGALKFLSVFCDAGPGVDMLASVDREPADLVVIDCLLFGALEAAAKAGVRRAALLHTFYGFMRKCWTRSPMAIGARVKRRNPMRLWSDTDVALVTALPQLDPGTPGVAPPFRHTGPILQETSLSTEHNGEAVVLASLSTIDYPGQDETLQRIIDGLADLPLRLVVTSGPAVDPDSLRPARNSEIHRYIPHSELMPQASLVIGHGGHSTAMRALAHGLPEIVIPVHPFLDHRMVGEALERAGAGTVLRMSAKPAEIRATVERMLSDPGYRAAAERLGGELRGRNGAQVAAAELESLVAEPVACSVGC